MRRSLARGGLLLADNCRADYGRGGPGFQFFPFMAIFSTNSIICQSVRSFPKLPLYGTQSYVKWGGPVQRSLNLKFLRCGGAVLEVHNRGLRKLDLVTQKFFIKKIFFYHIFPFPYKKILNFIYASRSEKNFFICQLEKFYIFYHILEERMEASLFDFHGPCHYSLRLPLPHSFIS